MTEHTFTGEYPIAFAGISKLNERQLTRFKSIIPIISQSLENKEVISTVMADLKYAANHLVEYAYKDIINEVYTYAGKWKNQPEELYYLNTPYEVRNVNAYLKKLNKLSPETKETPMFKDAFALSTELLNLQETFELLKAYTIKARDKKQQEKALADTEEDKFVKQITEHEDSKKVITLLKQTASDVEYDLYTKELEYLNKIVNHYKEKSAELNDTNYYEIYKKSPIYRMVLQNVLDSTVEQSTYKRTYQLKPNYEAILDKEAKKEAAAIVDRFVYRNGKKLAFIMYSKNNLESVEIKNVEVGRGMIECDVDCQFLDGSKFIANSSIVYSVSKYNRPFYRYPTTFRNVIMPDGTSMTSPSEQKMDEVFSIAKIENNSKSRMKP